MALTQNKTGYDEVVPRDISFKLNSSTVKKYWFNNDPWNSVWMSAILAAVPEAERWVMRSAAMQLDKVKDPEVKKAGQDFCRQERVHAREHDEMNKLIIEAGMPLHHIENRFVELREFLKKHLSPEMQGSLAASFEHFTAILSSVFLEHPEVFKDTHPEIVDLLFWHFVEETEHKSVSFDVFTQASGSGPVAYFRRVAGMATSTAVGIPGMTAAAAYLLWNEKQLTNLPSAIRMLDTMFGNPGLLRHIGKLYFPYYNPQFHPWEDDNREVIQIWKDAYERTEDASLAFQEFCEWHESKRPKKSKLLRKLRLKSASNHREPSLSVV